MMDAIPCQGLSRRLTCLGWSMGHQKEGTESAPHVGRIEEKEVAAWSGRDGKAICVMSY